MSRKIIKNIKNTRKIIKKSTENEPKTGSRRVVSKQNPYLYAHLFGNDSIKRDALHVKISRLGLPLEFSFSPSGCKCYRILKENADLLDFSEETGRYYLHVSDNIEDIPLQNEDRFYFLHTNWVKLERII